MTRHLRRLAAWALPVLLALAIGYAWGLAANDPSAEAQAPTRAPAKVGKVQRFGSVVGLRPQKKDYYVELHANTWPSVLRQIKESNIRNYSIYLTELDGKLYLFSYFEYVGDDFQADMARMAEDPETQRWWKETDPCQFRIPGTPEGQQWKRMTEVFHTD